MSKGTHKTKDGRTAKKGKRNLKAEKKRIVRSLNSRGAAKRGHGKEIK